jgi:hypothetical protein
MQVEVKAIICPVVGRLYRNVIGIEYQVSNISPGHGQVEIIPTDTSVPQWVSYLYFYRLFGSQEGR